MWRTLHSILVWRSSTIRSRMLPKPHTKFRMVFIQHFSSTPDSVWHSGRFADELAPKNPYKFLSLMQPNQLAHLSKFQCAYIGLHKRLCRTSPSTVMHIASL